MSHEPFYSPDSEEAKGLQPKDTQRERVEAQRVPVYLTRETLRKLTGSVGEQEEAQPLLDAAIAEALPLGYDSWDAAEANPCPVHSPEYFPNQLVQVPLMTRLELEATLLFLEHAIAIDTGMTPSPTLAGAAKLKAARPVSPHPAEEKLEEAAAEFDRRAKEKFDAGLTKQGCCYENAAAHIREMGEGGTA